MPKKCVTIPSYFRADGVLVQEHERCYEDRPLTAEQQARKERILELISQGRDPEKLLNELDAIGVKHEPIDGIGDDAIPSLTEDGEGNYIFYHYSNERLDEIDPSKFGQNPITSRDERAALQGAPQSFFYTQPDFRESGVGDVQHQVKIPKSEVYDITKDPNNYYSEASERFARNRGDVFSFGPNAQIAWVNKVASENGYKIGVARWGDNPNDIGYLRGQSSIVLTPEAENGDYLSNLQKGSLASLDEADSLEQVYDDIHDFYNDRGEYNNLYHWRNSQDFNSKFSPFDSQEDLTRAIDESDLPSEIKGRYSQLISDTTPRDNLYYHATNEEFTVFDGGNRGGYVYLSPNPSEARGAANRALLESELGPNMPIRDKVLSVEVEPSNTYGVDAPSFLTQEFADELNSALVDDRQAIWTAKENELISMLSIDSNNSYHNDVTKGIVRDLMDRHLIIDDNDNVTFLSKIGDLKSIENKYKFGWEHFEKDVLQATKFSDYFDAVSIRDENEGTIAVLPSSLNILAFNPDQEDASDTRNISANYLDKQKQREVIESYTHYTSLGGQKFVNSTWANWFVGEDVSAKQGIALQIDSDKQLQNALKSSMYDLWKESDDFDLGLPNKDLTFEEFLNSDIKVYRGLSDRNIEKGGNFNELGFNSYTVSRDRATAYTNGDESRVLEIDKKVSDLVGATNIVGGEIEIIELTDFSDDFVNDLNTRYIATDEFYEEYEDLTKEQQEVVSNLLDNNPQDFYKNFTKPKNLNAISSKLSRIVLGTQYENMTLEEILATNNGRDFLREAGYFA